MSEVEARICLDCSERCAYRIQLEAANARIADLTAQNAALVAALEVYADERNWTTTDLYEFPDLWTVSGENGPDRARALLAQQPEPT